eukprot:44364_1
MGNMLLIHLLTFYFSIIGIVEPATFKWGTATAAYQIEGAVNADGRLPSIWDTFSALPNKVYKNQTGKIADDNYHRYLEDIDLMKDLNLSHYRLSFAWTRILPDGRIKNQQGIDHYRNVINALLAVNIQPYVTLYHWDLPQNVYDLTNGGWINESVIDYFYEYAQTVFDNFNDIVKHWITFNEPWTFCYIGYGTGGHAPGRCTNCKPLGGDSSIEPYQCAHNVLLAHAKAVKYFRLKNYDTAGGKIGITLNVDWTEPASISQSDYDASQRKLIWSLAWFADPIFKGDYPNIMKQYIGNRLPTFTTEQKIDLNGSHDFFGLNHYTTKWTISTDKYNGSFPTWDSDQRAISSPCNQYNNTPIGYKADSDWLWDVSFGIYKIIKWIDNRYGKQPIYITENGCDVPNESELLLNEILNDTFRIRFYDGYITSVTKAKDEGSNIQAYFAWSFMDNFEWSDGYNKRFGLHFVNYSTNNLTRYKKQSAIWYSNYINKYNIYAQYKGPTLQPRIMTNEYVNSVCPTPQPTATPILSTIIMSTSTLVPDNKSNNKQSISTVGMVFLIIGILIVVLLLAFIAYKLIIKSKMSKNPINYQQMSNNNNAGL